MGIVLDPIKCFPAHPSDEILEEYGFHRLPEALSAQVEEHLLICPRCQDGVTETDRFVSALKVAVKQPIPAPGPARSIWQNSLAAVTNVASGSLVPVAALVLLALVVVWKQPQEASTPVRVSLSSMRGSNALSPAPAEKPLDLTIEAPDLASGKEYSLEVVDAAGRPVWRGAVSDVNGKLTATMSEPLRKGVYWVRLYGEDSGLLREFGLSAK
jgi:hypothetical protein